MLKTKKDEYLKLLKKARKLRIYKASQQAKELLNLTVKTAYECVIKIDDKRELDEDKIVELMNKLAQNKKYIELKNKGADALIEYGIKAGITLAEGYLGRDIQISEDIIDNFADKGGDVFVKVFDGLLAKLKKFLNKKSKRYLKRQEKKGG